MVKDLGNFPVQKEMFLFEVHHFRYVDDLGIIYIFSE